MNAPETVKARRERVMRKRRRGVVAEKIGAGIIVAFVALIFVLGGLVLVLSLIRLIRWLA